MEPKLSLSVVEQYAIISTYIHKRANIFSKATKYVPMLLHNIPI